MLSNPYSTLKKIRSALHFILLEYCLSNRHLERCKNTLKGAFQALFACRLLAHIRAPAPRSPRGAGEISEVEVDDGDGCKSKLNGASRWN